MAPLSALRIVGVWSYSAGVLENSRHSRAACGAPHGTPEVGTCAAYAPWRTSCPVPRALTLRCAGAHAYLIRTVRRPRYVRVSLVRRLRVNVIAALRIALVVHGHPDRDRSDDAAPYLVEPHSCARVMRESVATAPRQRELTPKYLLLSVSSWAMRKLGHLTPLFSNEKTSNEDKTTQQAGPPT